MNDTPTVRKCLQIVANDPGLRPDAFARQYFGADHPGWQRHTRCGYGTRKGGGLVLWAGGQLGKLRAAGLVTKNGRDVLLRDSPSEPGS